MAVEEDVLYVLDLLVDCGLLFVLALLGIFGNISNILVLRLQGFTDTTNMILISLSFTDLLVSVLYTLTQLHTLISQFNIVLSITIPSLLGVCLLPLTFTLIAISICHTTFIAVERAVAVCFPFHVTRIFTRSATKNILIAIYALTFGLTSPHYFIAGFQWSFNEFLNATIATIVEEPFPMDHVIFNTYSLVFVNILYSVVTLIIIVVCSFLIIIQLIKMGHKNVAKQARYKKNELKVFKTLLVVCVVAAIIWIPTCLMDFITQYATQVSFTTAYLCQDVKTVLYMLSSSVNFIIYITTSSKFYKTYKRIFCRGEYRSLMR
ncbi:nociceptin receptor-like [Physella acuta]|uniref:nociceptin receptor-like n=1 Tax=Physella acuta TaxID=109671 RepID=UPI0027DBC9B6|nr:nociceptin receptor-like [Physella acuta]